jgi:hypothetical protein
VLGDDADLDLAVVEARPEEVAAFALDGARDPWSPILGARPDEAAVPWRLLRDVRMAAIGDGEPQALAGALWGGEMDGDEAAVVLP